jgi:D-aminoacyl-tRNA deacylase
VGKRRGGSPDVVGVGRWQGQDTQKGRRGLHPDRLRNIQLLKLVYPMRILLQRVSRAQVEVEGRSVGTIGRGLVLLVGVHQEDGESEAVFCAEKCANLRVFEDDEGRMNRSVLEVGGQVLAVSQFTLYGDCRKGRRPSFIQAARPETAEPLYRCFVDRLRTLDLAVECGIFGADMQVEIHNDGPVTLVVESPSL